MSNNPGVRRNGQTGISMLVLIMVTAGLMSACEPGPSEIHYGQEECAHCRMIISQPEFASQIVNSKGRSFSFDSIECMLAYANGLNEDEATEIHSRWVSDFSGGDEWVPAEEAWYLHSEQLQSPMGANLSSYRDRPSAAVHQEEYGGRILRLDGVLEMMKEEHDPQHDPHNGHAGTTRKNLVVQPGTEISSIGQAVDLAQPGDHILVEKGLYKEYGIRIEKPLTLEGREGAVLDGDGQGTLLMIHSDGVTISGLQFENTGRSHIHDYSAIRVEDASDVIIENNRIFNTFFGIHMANATGGVIRENYIRAHPEKQSMSGNGIHLWKTTEVEILDNRVEQHRDGIYLEFASDLVVSGNRSIDNNRYGLHFMFSDNSEYSGNLFRHNGAGVAVMYSKNVDMSRNRFENHWGSASYGLLIKDMSDGRIENNQFTRNTVGIYSEGCTQMIIRGNHIEQNGWAVKIKSNSMNNRFEANNFIENSFDVATDARRNSNEFLGNYWSHYDGYDLDRDGIGDIPYRPVRLFSLLTEYRPESMVMLRSLLVSLLDSAERILPVLTPKTVVDHSPKMVRIHDTY